MFIEFLSPQEELEKSKSEPVDFKETLIFRRREFMWGHPGDLSMHDKEW